MGGHRAKQFLELAGVPVIIHTLRRFEQCASIHEIVVVLPQDERASFLELASKYSLLKLASVVAGGRTRAESVWRGLQSVRAQTANVVAVHDGVRPFVTPEEIGRAVEAAELGGASILAAPVVDTIKEVRGVEVLRTVERSSLMRALTPQCFRYEILRRAFESAGAEGFDATDDSLLVERLGVPVTIVEGDARNIKITRPEDIAFAEILLKQNSEFRTQKSE